jgi:glutathione synthase/RimK-type ligase-like ATP-grasp enzyme
MQTIIVTDDVKYWHFLNEYPVISAEEYLQGKAYRSRSIRVLNLCESYKYQTLGYYVSLLAMAREQQVFPTVQAIQDCTNIALAQQCLADMDKSTRNHLAKLKAKKLDLDIYFGECVSADFSKLAKKIHEWFPLPLLSLNLARTGDRWSCNDLSILSFSDIPLKEKKHMHAMAHQYVKKKSFHHSLDKKTPYFKLAMLVDPKEKNPASDPKALEKFVEAGEALRIKVDLITKKDIKVIPGYAGLFLRATPDVTNFTYKFLRCAVQENLALIDDPQTIIRCNDKVYQAEAFKKHNIKTPQTIIVNRYQQDEISVSFPCVIKRPDNGFCKDILKAENEKQLKRALERLFKYSDLLVIQSFLPSEFDWRIGILDGKPVYVSKYFMAPGHWQVINWKAEDDDDSEGDHESLTLNRVPKDVLETALRATQIMGDGFYGVDIKSCNHEHYVMEVNSVPGIFHGIEDVARGKDMYQQVMQVFLQRMQAKQG